MNNKYIWWRKFNRKLVLPGVVLLGCYLLLSRIHIFDKVNFTREVSAASNIPIVDTSAANDGVNVSSISWKHHVGNNSNTVLLVGVGTGFNNTPVSSVTYNGVALKRLAALDCSTICHDELWYLLNPPLGDHDVIVKLAGNDNVVGGSVTIYNLDPHNPLGAIKTAAAGSGGKQNGNSSISIPTTKNQLILDTVIWDDDTHSISANSGQIAVWDKITGKGAPGTYADYTAGGGSTKVGNGGTMNLGWQAVSDYPEEWVEIAIPLNATVGPTDTPVPTLPGVSATPTLSPTPAGSYGISGTLFVDTNGDKKLDNGEKPYLGSGLQIEIQNQTGTPPFDQKFPIISGTFDSGATLADGDYTVSYLGGLPLGYYMTEPDSGPPPAFGVSVGLNCDTGGSLDARCIGGNIQNLNFGFTNIKAWVQSVCGDIRQDSGIQDPIPASPSCGGVSGAYAIISNAVCPVSQGVAFSGGNTPSFGQGQASKNNWQAGGGTFPEIYSPPSTGIIPTSYEYISGTVKQSGITPTDLAKVCSLNNCDLSTLSHGIYQTAADLTLASKDVTVQSASNIIILVKGNLFINGGITLPQDSTIMFSTSGDIHVGASVGEKDVSSKKPTIAGIFSADGSFIVDGNGSGVCTDKRLNIAGSVIVNAAKRGGIFDYQKRDLCSDDVNCPAVSLIQRPDLIFNMPAFVKRTTSIFQELAP